MSSKVKIADKKRRTEKKKEGEEPLNVEEMIDKLEEEMETTGTIDRDESIRTMFLVLFSPSSLLNWKKMKDKLATLESENASLKNELTNLDQRFLEITNQEETLKTRMESENASLKSDLANLEERIQEKMNQENSLRSRVETLETENNLQKVKLDELENKTKGQEVIKIEEEVKDRISTIETENESQKTKIENLAMKIKTQEKKNQKDGMKKQIQKQLLSLEVDTYKTKYLISNIPEIINDSEEKTERKEDTTKAIEEVLQLSGQSLSSVREVRRLYPKNQTSSKNQKAKPKILVNFISMDQVRKFKGALQTIRKKEKFAEVNYSSYCPPSLLPDYKNANKRGYIMREGNKELRYRTIITNEKIILKVRKSPNDSYEEVNWKD